MNNHTPEAAVALRYLTSCEDFKKVITKNTRYTILEFDNHVYKVAECGKVTYA